MNIINRILYYLGIKKEKSINFITSNEILPQPLNTQEELDALIAYENGDLLAREKLIEHNLRLVVYIAKRYESNPIFMEDLISIGSIGLIKAVNTFKRDKNIKLVTYASRCIENEILMYLRKKSKRKIEVSFDEPLNVDYDGNELLLSDIVGNNADYAKKELEKKDNAKNLYKAMDTLKTRERIILEMRYGINRDELTQKDIADLLGISQSYISRLEKRIIKKLRKQFNEDSLV